MWNEEVKPFGFSEPGFTFLSPNLDTAESLTTVAMMTAPTLGAASPTYGHRTENPGLNPPGSLFVSYLSFLVHPKINIFLGVEELFSSLAR